jgi:hypothetical protein
MVAYLPGTTLHQLIKLSIASLVRTCEVASQERAIQIINCRAFTMNELERMTGSLASTTYLAPTKLGREDDRPVARCQES